MRVNSAFTGLFANRLMGSGITIVMLAVFLISSSFTKPSDHGMRAKQVNLLIRQIGHLLLLQAGDSTSRVLPVTEIKEGTFLLKFENEFVFSHDSLIVLSRDLLPKTRFPSGYTVTVQDCMNGDIVYAFQVNHASRDILACKGRGQPAGCYTIEFAFADFYEHVKQNESGNYKPTESVKAGPGEAKPKLAEFKTKIVEPDPEQQKEEHRSVRIDPRESAPKLEAVKTKASNYPLTNLVYGSMLALLVVGLLIGRFGKILKPKPVEHQTQATPKESVPELAALGTFLFNVKGQCLLLGSEVISLSDKECKILELLFKNFGELVLRETLMQEVWISEGVITGRSLDMFISKIRKKLGADPGLRITNIHGKGYRLETV